MRRAALLGAVALTLFTAVPAEASAVAAQSEESIDPSTVFDQREDGSLVHRLSGFEFPARLGPLPLVGPNVIAEDDIMARYSLSDDGLGDAWLDLILYPAEQPFDEEAKSVESLIVEHFQAKAIADPGPSPAAAGDGRHGWYQGSIDGEDMVTTYVLVKRGGWLMKIRATARASAGRPAVDQLVAAIAAAPWAWTPKANPERPDKPVALR